MSDEKFPIHYLFNIFLGCLIEQLSNSSYECMVCCDSVRREHAVWSCSNCYHVYHLHCIKKWARSSSAADKGLFASWKKVTGNGLEEKRIIVLGYWKLVLDAPVFWHDSQCKTAICPSVTLLPESTSIKLLIEFSVHLRSIWNIKQIMDGLCW